MKITEQDLNGLPDWTFRQGVITLNKQHELRLRELDIQASGKSDLMKDYELAQVEASRSAWGIREITL